MRAYIWICDVMATSSYGLLKKNTKNEKQNGRQIAKLSITRSFLEGMLKDWTSQV